MTRMPTTTSTLSIASLLLLLLAGCAGATTGPAAGQDPAPSPTAAAAAPGYSCARVPVSEEDYTARDPLEEADAATRTAFAEATSDSDERLGLTAEEGWFVVGRSDEMLSLLREAPGLPDAAHPDAEAGHEVVEILRSNDPDGPDWRLAQRSTCALQRDLGGLGVPGIALAAPRDPASDRLELLVTETSCSSGRDAEGRIEVVRLEEDADRVLVVLGVRPFPGAQDCQGAGPTPFSLQLAAALGDRVILDGGFAEPRPLAAAAAAGS